MSKNNDIEEILLHWNNCEIIVHKKLDKLMRHVIGSVLDERPKEELMEAITLYAQCVHSPDSFWTHKWRIEQFFKQANGFRNFLPESEPLIRYKAGKSSDSEGTTPPVPSVSPAFLEEFKRRKKQLLRDSENG